MARRSFIGSNILGYNIVEEIGQGGFGTVYKAEKKNESGTYIRAIKHITIPNEDEYGEVLNSMGGNHTKTEKYFSNCLENLTNEIKILDDISRKGASNIVVYYDHEIVKSLNPLRYDVFIMMEYLTPYSKYLSNNELTVENVVDLGLDVLTALKLCHKSGIIHRDIKEDNVFVADIDGKLVYKIGDFGISKLLENSSKAMSMKGTPNYIAPEVYMGKDLYTSTVDIYSLGVMMYKLLNHLRYPFMPKFPEEYNEFHRQDAFDRRISGEIPELPDNCAEELGRTIIKAISGKDDRYTSVEEFYNELLRVKENLSLEELELCINNKDDTAFENKTELKSEEMATVGNDRFNTEEIQEVGEADSPFGEFKNGVELTFAEPTESSDINKKSDNPVIGDNKVKKEKVIESKKTYTEATVRMGENDIYNEIEYRLNIQPKKKEINKVVIYLVVVISTLVITMISLFSLIPSVFIFCLFMLFILVIVGVVYGIMKVVNSVKKSGEEEEISLSTEKDAYYLCNYIVGKVSLLNVNEDSDKINEIIEKLKLSQDKIEVGGEYGKGGEQLRKYENEIVRLLKRMREFIDTTSSTKIILKAEALEKDIREIEYLITKRNELMQKC